MNKFKLNKEDAVLLVIDIQDKLAAAMPQRQPVIDNTVHLIELAKMIKLPVILTEQYPKGLGSTVDEIREVLPAYKPLEKITFDCCGADGFFDAMRQTGRRSIVVAGMETHICVLQTTVGLIEAGYDVHLISDAICSRTKENWKIGLSYMQQAGAVITCTETVLFQLFGKAGTEEFKMVSKRIK
ncbi:MAG TPA: hydrolase [Candidatus Aquicultor sp.]|jgi:nicotinamidase-related amidase